MAEKRILVADADAKAREEFRQALGEGWVLVGADTGTAAQTETRRQAFDVIVASYDLPELDGVELLNRVRESHPKTLRFISAPENRREEIMLRAQGHHEFLASSFDRAKLKSSIERALSHQYGLSQNMRDLVSRIRTFPTMPSLYIEVCNALKNPNATTDDIGLIIAKDMAMTTKLVQVLNSAYFGLPRTITDPTEAVGILGFETVKSLIMTVKLLSQYDKCKPVYFSIDNIWKHSTNVARTAKAMALLETGDTDCSAHAYTAGLMHDLGKVILAANFDEQYNGAHKLARNQKVPLWEVEQDLFGATHGEIGAYLLGLWGMSADVVQVAALHHHPLRSGDKTFSPLTAVHVANALEYEANPGNDGLPVPVVDTEYVTSLGLEARIELWRDAQRDPSVTVFETKKQRAKAAAAKAAAGPIPAAPAPTPVVNKFAPAALPAAAPLWQNLSKWVGLGLGAAAVLVLLGWLEIMRVQHTTEKPEAPAVAVHVSTPVKHEIATVAAPPKPPAPATAPVHPAPEIVVQPTPTPAPVPAPAPAPVPEKSAFDRLKLEAIFFSVQHPSALINGQLASVNSEVAECRVLDISRSSVTLEYQHQRKTLNLQ